MNSAQAAAMSRMRTPLKPELMLGEIVDAFADESNAGRKQFVVAIAPVEGDAPQRDLALRLYVPRAQEGDGPSELGKCRAKGYSFLRAVDKDFPTYPKRVAKGVYESANGAQMNYDESAAESARIDAQVFDGIEALTPSIKNLKGTRVYFKPGKATMDEQKRVSQFIDRVFSELRDGDTVLDSGVIDEATQQEFLATLTAEG